MCGFDPNFIEAFHPNFSSAEILSYVSQKINIFLRVSHIFQILIFIEFNAAKEGPQSRDIYDIDPHFRLYCASVYMGTFAQEVTINSPRSCIAPVYG